MERRWDHARPLLLHMIAAGVIVAASALLLPIMGQTLTLLARELGVLIGRMAAAILREIFSALGIFVRPDSDGLGNVLIGLLVTPGVPSPPGIRRMGIIRSATGQRQIGYPNAV